MSIAQPTKPESALLRTLAGYEIRELDSVVAFLRARPHAESALKDAPANVERAFGLNFPLRLKLFRDREEPGSAELVVEIVTGSSGGWEEDDRKLQRLHELWLSGLPREVTRDILFVTEPE